LTPPRVLRLGAVGLGRAFLSMAPSLIQHPCVKLVAVADPNGVALGNCARDFGARVYTDAEELLADPGVDAVYIATPHELHVPHTLAALARGKHVLLEKPMALSLADSQLLVDSAEAADRRLVIGHSHGFDRPFVEAARLIAGGGVGKLRMVTGLNFTNWIYRPRRPEELTTGSPGVILNQASHQVDILRLLAGGRASWVRASAAAWDSSRPAVGAYSALVQFEGGAFANLTYSGYDHFDSDEFNGWIGELGRAKSPHGHGSAIRRIAQGTPEGSEATMKAGVGYAGIARTPPPDNVDLQTQWHQQFGLVIASCERADLRISGTGIMVYDAAGVRHVPVEPAGGARAGVFDELHAAVLLGQPTIHSGRWGMANLELCLAILESARTQQEVRLHCQVPLPSGLP
jgi:phthalate 4,5-cis-dihydrodiol dehydrogenase